MCSGRGYHSTCGNGLAAVITDRISCVSVTSAVGSRLVYLVSVLVLAGLRLRLGLGLGLGLSLGLSLCLGLGLRLGHCCCDGLR